MCQKRPLHIKKRPEKCQKRCIHTREICESTTIYATPMLQKRPIHIKRDQRKREKEITEMSKMYTHARDESKQIYTLTTHVLKKTSKKRSMKIKRDLHTSKEAKTHQKRPMICQKRPMICQKRPIICQKRPMICQKRPMICQKRCIFTRQMCQGRTMSTPR